MTEASNSRSTPTRRGALAGAALAQVSPAAPMVAVAAEPDAALLAACEELKAVERATREVDEDPRISDAAVGAVARRWSAAVESESDLPATTPAGIRAKAEALRLVLRREVPVHFGETFEDSCEPHEWLAFKLAEDIVLRLAGGEA